MANLLKITGVKGTLAGLRAEKKKFQKLVGNVDEVHVGYTSAYSVYVHEAVAMKLKGKPRPTKGKYWDPQGQGQAKFLEEPARTHAKRIGEIAGKAFENGASMSQSLLVAGLYLQRESQKLVPVDLGNLKNSAFTRLIKK